MDQKSASRQKKSENKKPSHSAKHVTHWLLQDELEADESSTEIKNKNDDTNRSRSTNDAPRQWNLGKQYQSLYAKNILYCTEMIMDS